MPQTSFPCWGSGIERSFPPKVSFHSDECTESKKAGRSPAPPRLRGTTERHALLRLFRPPLPEYKTREPPPVDACQTKAVRTPKSATQKKIPSSAPSASSEIHPQPRSLPLVPVKLVQKTARSRNPRQAPALRGKEPPSAGRAGQQPTRPRPAPRRERGLPREPLGERGEAALPSGGRGAFSTGQRDPLGARTCPRTSRDGGAPA